MPTSKANEEPGKEKEKRKEKGLAAMKAHTANSPRKLDIWLMCKWKRPKTPWETFKPHLLAVVKKHSSRSGEGKLQEDRCVCGWKTKNGPILSGGRRRRRKFSQGGRDSSDFPKNSLNRCKQKAAAPVVWSLAVLRWAYQSCGCATWLYMRTDRSGLRCHVTLKGLCVCVRESQSQDVSVFCIPQAQRLWQAPHPEWYHWCWEARAKSLT